MAVRQSPVTLAGIVQVGAPRNGLSMSMGGANDYRLFPPESSILVNPYKLTITSRVIDNEPARAGEDALTRSGWIAAIIATGERAANSGQAKIFGDRICRLAVVAAGEVELSRTVVGVSRVAVHCPRDAFARS